MKKCPTCEKTFEDSMRFCQVDGTPLVDDAPAFDPYATIVAQPIPTITPVEEPAAEVAPEEAAVEAPAEAPTDVVEEPEDNMTIGSLPIAEPEDVLDLPANDPLKTMYVSEGEMEAALGGGTDTTEDPGMEIPPIDTTPEPEAPSFTVPDVPAPSFGDASPPPSPFSASDSSDDAAILAPPVFEEPEPAVSSYDAPTELAPPKEIAPEPPPFEEAATMIQPNFSSPFDPPPPAPVAEWTPPPAPDASWQNQEIGSNTPFQPPPAGTGSVNQTLPIISLILGIASLCCYISPITGIAALITGYLGMTKANTDPANYGGKGLAIAGMITGGIFLLIGLVYWIIIIFFGGLSLLMGR
ncbi:MAG: DUF4190 domain-containing protein [Acidobacteriota bacterium]